MVRREKVSGGGVLLVDWDAADGPVPVVVGGQAVAAGGFEAVAEDLGDGDDVFAVADHNGAGGVAQGVGRDVPVDADLEACVFGDGGEDAVGAARGQPAAAGVEEQCGVDGGAGPAGPFGAPGVQGCSEFGVQRDLAVFAVPDDQVAFAG